MSADELHIAFTVSLTCWIIFGTGCFILLLILCMNCVKSLKGIKIKRSILYYSIIAIIAFAVNCITAPVYQQSDPTTHHYIIFQVSSLHLWTWGCLFTYLIFIERVKVTKNTFYASPNWVYTVSYILCILFVLFEIIEQSILVLFNLNMINADEYGLYLAICIWSIEAVDLILCIMLISVFVSKLMKATVNIRSFSEESDSLSNQLNHHQNKLLYVITKNSYLSIIAVLSTQFMLIYWIIYDLIFYWALSWYITHPNLHLWMHHIGYILWAVHCFIESLCIMLSFEFNKWWYQKCCGKSHTKCQSCCAKMVIRKSRLSIEHEYELQASLINP